MIAKKKVTKSSRGSSKSSKKTKKSTVTTKKATTKKAQRSSDAKGGAAAKASPSKSSPASAASSHASSSLAGSSSAKRKNPQLVQNLLLLSTAEIEEHFERLDEEELFRLFDDSYTSDLVNILLGLKKSTCKRIFELATSHRKRAYLDAITLYYYKEYLSNPFPLELNGLDGNTTPNYYAIVGVARDATEEEIEMASKLLIKAFKLDSFPPSDRKLGDIRGKEIKAAFERIKTPKRRLEVNQILPSINYYYPKRSDSWLDMVQRFSP